MSRESTMSSLKLEMFDGNINSLIIKMASPILIGLLIQTIYTLTNTVWISQIDKSDPGVLGGFGLVGPILLMIFALSSGIMVGVSSLTARLIGEKKVDRLSSVVTSGFLLAAISSIVLLWFGYSSSEELVMGLGAKDSYFTNGHSYFRTLLPVIPLLMSLSIFHGVLQGEGKMKYVMVSMTVGTISTIILNYILLRQIQIGIKGAALSLLLGYGTSLLYMIILFIKGVSAVSFRDGFSGVTFRAVKEIVVVGLPQSLGFVIWGISIGVLNKLLYNIDPHAMTAFAIAGKVDYTVFIPASALGTALVTIVGQNSGRKLFDRVRDSWRAAVKITLAVTFVAATITYFIVPFIYPHLSDVESVVNYSIDQTQLLVYTYLAVGVTYMARSLFQGMGNAVPALIVTALRLILITIPAAIFFTGTLNLGVKGVWYSLMVGAFCSTVISSIWAELVLRFKIKKTR